MDKTSLVKSEASVTENVFEFNQFWHYEHTKLLKSKGSGSFKSSSKCVPVLLPSHQKTQ